MGIYIMTKSMKKQKGSMDVVLIVIKASYR